MANPRQRNKARSHKITRPSQNMKRRMHQKLRRAPPLKGPEVLQEAWDVKKTVFQNYAALGLLPTIPIPTNSTRSHKASLPFLPPHLRSALTLKDDDSETGSDDDGEGPSTSAAPKVGFGRIIRDADGNVIDIIIDEEPVAPVALAGEDEEEDMDDGKVWGGIAADEEDKGVRRVEAKTDVVRSLEALAATSKPILRHTSTSEKTWLHQMVASHGDDVEAMSRDRKLNVWQKTTGEIKRAIRKAGGVEKLRGQ